MFVEAIERAAEFTRPIHFISRNFGSAEVVPGAASLFFVNSEGWALTCRHVAEAITAADQMNRKYIQYRGELAASFGKVKQKQAVRDLARKFGYNPETVAEVKLSFVNCIEGDLLADMKWHPELDVALIQFKNFKNVLCSKFPVFAKDSTNLKQGRFLCRLGFPFPEFTNFGYDQAKDEIMWTNSGRTDTPRFPIEGMVTRLVGMDAQTIVGFELSTPGLRGQSGGPVFDTSGTVWGIQSRTNHLDLDFDVNQEVYR